MKQLMCRPVRSRSLIVGTGGFGSGAIALPIIDNGISSMIFGEKPLQEDGDGVAGKRNGLNANIFD